MVGEHMFLFEGGVVEKAEKKQTPSVLQKIPVKNKNDEFLPEAKPSKSQLKEISKKLQTKAAWNEYTFRAKELMAPKVAAAEEKEKQVLASKQEVCDRQIYELFSIKVNHYECPVSTLPKGVEFTVINLTDLHFRYYTPSKAPPYKPKSDDKERRGKEGNNPKYYYTNVQDRYIIDRFDNN